MANTPAVTSQAIEGTATSLGVRVQRLTQDILLCEQSGKRIVFKGMAGSGTGTLARELCGETIIRRFLASQGLPTRDKESPRPDMVFDLAVVNGHVIATSARSDDHPLPPAAAELAIRAVDAVPGAAYGAVAVAVVAAGGPTELMIDSVDPQFVRWAASASDEDRAAVARAIVEAELGR